MTVTIWRSEEDRWKVGRENVMDGGFRMPKHNEAIDIVLLLILYNYLFPPKKRREPRAQKFKSYHSIHFPFFVVKYFSKT